MTKTEVEKMNRTELRAAAKKAGIKYGKMSLLQIREALIAHKPVVEKTKKDKGPARAGSKMLAAIQVFKENSGLPRKSIIQKFIDDVKLTKAGASTYYQLISKKM